MPCTKLAHPKCLHFSAFKTFTPFILFWLLFVAIDTVNCLNFTYPDFKQEENAQQDHLKSNGNSGIVLGALQVTNDVSGAPIANLYGRILYNTPFKLWSKRKGKVGSFNTTFVLNITPRSDPPGEGMAFILTNNVSYIPNNSSGQWLGIVNETTNGSANNPIPIVAVEFDTKKSFLEDLDDNHVGVDINTVYSINQTSLKGSSVNISSGTDVNVTINYNGTTKELKVFVFYNNDTSGPNTKNPVISMPLDLSDYLSEVVYVGFSASTSNFTQLNCVKSWSFTGSDVEDSIAKWVWVVVASLSTVLVASVIACYVYTQIKKARNRDAEQTWPLDETKIDVIDGIGPRKYQFKELKSATANFNPNNEIGRGGFGIVYKGSLNGEEVAVKRILKNTQQGRKNMIAEITTIGCLRHKNLVKLTGWCYEKNEVLLVCEYMPNGSLDNLLFPKDKQNETALSWERRYNIVCGVAQSLDYLHNGYTQRVLHRDIKTSNIMLDGEFNPCLGDFGLARMFKITEKTHHTTHEIAGTWAYMAPEHFLTGQATTQTDVYSFGVLVLEVVCGRRPGIQTPDGKTHIIVDRVWEFYNSGMICDAIDPKLDGCFDKDQADNVLLLGLACCHPNPHMRPSIRSALQVLMGEAHPPVVPFEKPAFVWPVLAPSLTGELDGSFSGGMLSSPGSFSGR